ncbi:hypothetical protein HDV02_004004 [Globomyces sp. JEL0801]|nr:hypothetical protein HDV02_004004 [Globomyces sp. JEL0801]
MSPLKHSTDDLYSRQMIGQVETGQVGIQIEWESLDNQINLTDFSKVDMDVDFDSIVDTMMMTHHVSPESSSLNAAILAKDISSIYVLLEKQLLKADWPIQTSRAPQLDLNSKCDLHSFPFIQQQVMDQSESFISTSESHLDGGDNVSARFDFSNASPNSDSGDEDTIIGKRHSTAIIIEDSDEDMYEEYHFINGRNVAMNSDLDVSFVSNGSTLIDITPDTPPHLPVDPPILYTLRPKGPAANDAAYLAGVPYQVFKIAVEPANSLLEPAPVFAANGDALHLYFEIASEDAVKASFTEKKRAEYEALVVAAMKKTGMTREQLKNSGPLCCGITLTVGARKYSLACFYGHKRNAVNCSPGSSTTGEYQGLCRCCRSHDNALRLRLKCTFDPQSALEYKASMLDHNGEFTLKVGKQVSFSAVLRVLDNGGFLHIKTQADVNMIRTPLSKADQKIYLTRILARSHYGFRTGALLILLTEAGINMVSFDRTDSSKKIDEIGQTIIADTWGFNRLSNVLSEVETDQVLAMLLAGDYADGNAAFIRRNSDVQNPPRLSDEWEAAIEQKWNSQSSLARYQGRPVGRFDDYPDIRFWGGFSEFQRLCRLNANTKGNLVCEMTGIELTPDTWGVDRAINGIVAGISGEYRSSHTIFVHQRLNDFKESGGRKIFKDVETLEMEKSMMNITEQDHRISTILILRHYLDPIRAFRSSQSYRDNMARLAAAK